MPIGKGMFGSPKGTYGKYDVGSNLSRQFERAEAVEETQRRRFKRKRESGFVGNGYWFGLYPYMVGAMGSYNPNQTPDTNEPQGDSGQTASDASGLGDGGTAAGFVGGLGS